MAITPASSLMLGAAASPQALGALGGPALGGVYPGGPDQAGLGAASLQYGAGAGPGGAAGLDGAVPLMGPGGSAGLDGAVPLSSPLDSTAPLASPGRSAPASGSFEDALSFIDQAAAQESDANALETAFAQGKNVPLHDVMAAAEEAELSLETLAALRDRVLDAVKQLTQMQV